MKRAGDSSRGSNFRSCDDKSLNTNTYGVGETVTNNSSDTGSGTHWSFPCSLHHVLRVGYTMLSDYFSWSAHALEIYKPEDNYGDRI